MDEKLNLSIQQGLIFGIISSVVLPFGYEFYGNLSHTISIFLLIIYSVFVAIKFCKFKFSQALVGLLEMLILGFGLTIITFMLVHPRVVSFLNSHSKYFSMSTSQSATYFLKAGATLLGSIAICGFKALFVAVLSKIKKNGELTKSYIDNAFDE